MRVGNKNLFPLAGMVILIASIGLSWYSVLLTIHGFRIFLPEIILFLFGLIGVPYLLLQRGRIEIRYLVWPVVILGLMVISSALSLKPLVSFKETLRWGELFLAFFLALNFSWTAKEVKAILIVVIVLGILQALWGIKLLNSGASAGRLVSGYFDNANQMALCLDLSLVLTVAFFLGTRDFWWKIWWIYCFIFLGVSLFLTRSRGAELSNVFLLMLFSLALLYQKTGKQVCMGILRTTGSIFFRGVIILFFPLLLFVSFAPGSTERLLTKSLPEMDDALRSRLYYYTIGFRIIEDFPLFGVGGNLYKEVAPYYIPSYTPKDYVETLQKYELHNFYITIAAENGILTFMAFLFFLHAVGKDVFSSLLSLNGERFWLLAGAGGSALAWLLHNLVDEGFSFTAIQWGILLGLAVSMKGIEPQIEKGRQGKKANQGKINGAFEHRASWHIPFATVQPMRPHETLID